MSSSALFAYTTLFRSLFAEAVANGVRGDALHDELSHGHADTRDDRPGQGLGHRDLVIDGVRRRGRGSARRARSEEHTSELQSRFDLVCRLLLEKKKLF